MIKEQHSLESFLTKIKNKSTETYFVCCSDFSKSKNGHGYNFRFGTPHFRAYYHCLNNERLDVSSEYVIVYEPSKRILDRMDVSSIVEKSIFVEYLINRYIEGDNDEVEFIIELVGGLGQSFDKKLVVSLCKLWANDNLDSNKISNFLKSNKLRKTNLLLKIITNDTEQVYEEANVRDLREIEKLSEDNFANKLVSTMISDINFYHILDWLVCNRLFEKVIVTAIREQFNSNVDLVSSLSKNSLKSVLTTGVIDEDIKYLSELINKFSVDCRSLLMDYLPLSLWPDFIECASDYHVASYLEFCEQNDYKEINTIVYDKLFFSIENEGWSDSKELGRFIVALNRPQSLSYISDYFSKVVPKKAHASLAVNVLKYNHNIPCFEDKVYDWISDFRNKHNHEFIFSLSPEILEYFWSKGIFKLNPAHYKEFLKLLSEKTCETFVKFLPNQYLPFYAEFCLEQDIIDYILVSYEQVTLEEITLLDDVLQEKHYFDAEFLISLVKLRKMNRSMSMIQVISSFRNYQEKLFSFHANHRTRIDCKILAKCQKKIAYLERVPLSSTPYDSFMVCEAKLWFLRTKDNEGNITEIPKALCRRHDCKYCVFKGMEAIEYSPNESKWLPIPNSPRIHTFQSVPFYSLCLSLFNITAEQLHQNEQFVKLVSALNRWNDILERLVCHCCNEPLQVSEHSPGAMGNMAVGTTYWHCGNESCTEYCKSVKISYCIGCQKVIDNRVDKHSCTPYEIKSYKKFYICTECGSCCAKHQGFSGICAHCGHDHAYSNVEDRRVARCKYCGKPVSISPFSFKALLQHDKDGGVFNDVPKLSAVSSHLIFTHTDCQEPFIVDLNNMQNKLFVYDLFHCLSVGILSRQMLARYNQSDIYDLKIMESMVTLGMHHKRYGEDAHNSNSLANLIDKLAHGVSYLELKSHIDIQISGLFDGMTSNNLWEHYNYIELPFIYALADLSREGIYIDKNYLMGQFSSLELERNKLVESLRKVGIDNPNIDSMIQYLMAKYGADEADAMCEIYRRNGAKSLISKDSVFEAISSIDRLERGNSILNQLISCPNPVKPKYQVIGATTGRCTSQDPNLLGLPKSFRHVIRAERGTVIVECDYKQMEIGVLAALSQDRLLIDDFNTGDVYLAFADKLNMERDEAKIIFLSIIYGIHASTLATAMDVPLSNALALIDGFYSRYRQVKEYQDRVVEQGRHDGFVSTKTGLKRYINTKVKTTASINQWENNWLRNYPVQANAAVIFKNAIIELSQELVEHGKGFKLLVPHYDAIVFQAPRDNIDFYIKQVKSAMIRAMRKTFPILEPKISVNRDNPEHW